MSRVKENQQNRSKGASHKNSNQRRLRQNWLCHFPLVSRMTGKFSRAMVYFGKIWRLKFEIQSERLFTHLNASIRWSRSTEYVTGVEQGVCPSFKITIEFLFQCAYGGQYILSTYYNACSLYSYDSDKRESCADRRAECHACLRGSSCENH